MTKRIVSVTLDRILSVVQKSGANVEQDANGFSFRGKYRTRLNVLPVNHAAKNGSRVTNIVTIQTELPGFPLSGQGAEAGLSTLNMNAVMSAIVQDEQVTRLANRLSVFEGDDETWELLYTPMLSFAVVSQSDAFFETVRRRAASSKGDRGEGLMLPAGDEPSYWGAADFDVAQRLLDREGFLANSDATGLAAEFAWDEGAISQMERFFGRQPGRTSLLKLTTDETHPGAGNGLFCRLTLPVSYPAEALPVAACRLNLLELRATDAPPFLGAWCVDPETLSLTFVTFWPNLIYRPGSAASLTVWMMARSEFAKTWIETDPVLYALGDRGRGR
jgi:hypothetical protein